MEEYQQENIVLFDYHSIIQLGCKYKAVLFKHNKIRVKIVFIFSDSHMLSGKIGWYGLWQTILCP